jgi:hypothetical protein
LFQIVPVAVLYPEQLLILRLPSIVANRPSLAQWATEAPMGIPGALSPSLLSKFSTDLKSGSESILLSVEEDKTSNHQINKILLNFLQV